MHANTSQTSSPGGAAESNNTSHYLTGRSRPRSRPRSHHLRALGQDSDEDTTTTTTIQMDEYELDHRHPSGSSKRHDDDADDDETEEGEDALMLGPASASVGNGDEEAYELRRSKTKHRAGRRHVSTGSISEKYDPDDPMHLVSKAVPEHDDPSLPALTWRAMLIGSFFCVIGAAIAQLFFYKSNSPSFSSYFVILISLPIGRWLANHRHEAAFTPAPYGTAPL